MTNKIHATAVIEGDVDLGQGNEIGPYCVLRGPLTIGDGNQIGPHVVIGTPGQDTRNPRYDSSACRIEIGHNNIIREFTAIQKPCYRDITRIGNDVFLMQSVHIPHDAIIEDEVVITPMVVLAGVTRVLQGANLGLGCSINQYVVIGQYSIVAMGAAAMKNVKPFSRYIPDKAPSVNEYAVEKFGFTDYLDEITRYVAHGAAPTSPRVSAVVAHYEQLHALSNRAQY